MMCNDHYHYDGSNLLSVMIRLPTSSLSSSSKWRYQIMLVIFTIVCLTNNNNSVNSVKYYQSSQYNQQNDDRLHFITEPESIWATQDGRRLIFKCLVNPNHAKIKWLLNGTIINAADNDNTNADANANANSNDNDDGINSDNNNSYYDWIKINDNKLSIKLPNPSSKTSDIHNQKQKSNQLNLQGLVFQCLAELNQKVIVSQPAKLIIAELNPFEDNEQQQDLNITTIVGNNIVIPCQLPHSIPMAVAEFEFNNKTITNSNNQDRYRILPSGHLLILNVKPYDQGSYRCIAHNPFLQEKMFAKHLINLKVLKPKNSNSDLKKLKFILLPKPQISAILGSNISMECLAHGFPVPKISWTKINGNLPKSRTIIDNGILKIFGVQKSDEGLYSCTAFNSKITLDSNTQLKILEMPQILNDDYEIFDLETGKNYQLECNAKGEPKPLISWLHNGYFIDSQITQDVLFEQDNSILKIIDANPSLHSGIYQCFATNELGATYAIKVINFKSSSSSSSGSSEDHYHAHHHHHNHDHHHAQHHYSINDNQFMDNDHNDHDHDSKQLDHQANYDLSSSSSSSSSDFSNEDHHQLMNHHHHNDNHDDTNGHGHSKNHHKHHGKHGNNKNNNHKELKLIPPSKPEVSKLNDDSVMVRWHVPKQTGLPIMFFKVQYKELGRGDWNTVDVDIPAHIYSYPVCCLNPNSTYRFRIAAVYSNDDNKNGKSSNKFIFHKDPSLKRPVHPPTIINATSNSPNQITVEWEYLNIEQQQVDGFFLNYRPADSAGQYLMVTVLGSQTRRQNISYLQPNQAYEIKMQCFNDAGTSDFSNIYMVKTIPSLTSKTNDDNAIIDSGIGHGADTNDLDGDDHDPDQILHSSKLPPLINNNKDLKEDGSRSNKSSLLSLLWNLENMQLIIIVIISIVIVILVCIVCSVIFCWRQKSSMDPLSSEEKQQQHHQQSSSTISTINKNKKKIQKKKNNNKVIKSPSDYYFTNLNNFDRRLPSTTTTTNPTSIVNNNNSVATANTISGAAVPISNLPVLASPPHILNSNHHTDHTGHTDHTDDTDDVDHTVDSTSNNPLSEILTPLNRRNSFRNSTSILSYSTHHLYNKNHHQNLAQDNQIAIANGNTATIDRKRSLKNSLPGSYLLEQYSSNGKINQHHTQQVNNHSNSNHNHHNHHTASFTRLNGTLERKRRSRNDLNNSMIFNNNHLDRQQQQNHNGGSYFHHHHHPSQNGAVGAANNHFVIMQSSC